MILLLLLFCSTPGRVLLVADAKYRGTLGVTKAVDILNFRTRSHDPDPKTRPRKISAPGRREPREIDEEMYKWRHLVENFIFKIKNLKRIAMRRDKTDESFLR